MIDKKSIPELETCDSAEIMDLLNLKSSRNQYVIETGLTVKDGVLCFVQCVSTDNLDVLITEKKIWLL